jgi:hypothetical protein
MKFFAVLALLLFSCFSSAQCVLPGENGSLIFTADTVALCNGYWLIPSSEYSAYLSVVELTASDYTEAFLWGFGVVITMAGLAYPVAIARGLVNKL